MLLAPKPSASPWSTFFSAVCDELAVDAVTPKTKQVDVQRKKNKTERRAGETLDKKKKKKKKSAYAEAPMAF